MTDPKNPNFEIPSELRDVAEKSVEQAKQALDGFMGAAHKAVDSLHESADSARAHAQDTTKKALTFAEQNISAAFDLAQKIARAKDPSEVLAHQTAFVASQLSAFQKQISDVGTAIQKAAASVTPKQK